MSDYSDAYQIGRDEERERIRANIIERVQDLSSCTKKDNCEELGALIASYVEEWLEGVGDTE